MSQPTPSQQQVVPPPPPPQQHQQHQQRQSGQNSRRPRRHHAMHGESRTLWMGSIQQFWNESDLLNLFAGTGEVVRVRMMRNAETGLPSGYAFIEFRSHAAARQVLESLNGQPIPGTNVYYRLNWGSRSRSSGGSSSSGGSGQQPGGASDASSTDAATSSATPPGTSSPSLRSRSQLSVYVGDLALETTAATLKEAFAARFSSCVDANVLVDAATGTSKRFGFVRFSNKEDCRAALRVMQNAVIDGRRVRVGPATRRPEGLSPTSSESSSHHHHRQESPRRAGGLAYASPPVVSRTHSVASMSSRTASTRSGSFSEASHASDDLNTLNVTTASHAASKPASSSSSSSDKAKIPRDDSDETDAGASTQDREEVHRRGGDGAPAAIDVDVDGASASAAGLGARPPPRTTVFIGNLDPKVDAEAIQAHFECCGTIESIKIPPNKGCGFVKFSTREEARRAIETLRGTMLGSQPVRLDWGKFSNTPRTPPASLPVPQTVIYPGQGSPSAWAQMPAMYYPGSAPGAQHGLEFAAAYTPYYGPYYPSSPPSSPMAAAGSPGAYMYSAGMMYGTPSPAMMSPQHHHHHHHHVAHPGHLDQVTAMMAAQQFAGAGQAQAQAEDGAEDVAEDGVDDEEDAPVDDDDPGRDQQDGDDDIDDEGDDNEECSTPNPNNNDAEEDVDVDNDVDVDDGKAQQRAMTGGRVERPSSALNCVAGGGRETVTLRAQRRATVPPSLQSHS